MLNIFMKSPLPNTLAVAVLIALIFTWFVSVILALRDTPVQTDSGWFAYLLPVFSLLAFPAFWDLLQTDGIAFLSAVIVLVVFILNVIIPILKIAKRSTHWLITDWYTWSVLVSCIGGLVMTIYLITTASVSCGPSHGCDVVQNSKYATLFGSLSVGKVGLIGYIGISLAWTIGQFGPESVKKTAVIAGWGMCFFGVLFSAYLTFLEPFVIGATCMWCISSAVLMISLLLASTPSAQQAFAIPDEGDEE